MTVREAAERAAKRYQAYRRSRAWRYHLDGFVELWGDYEVSSLTSEDLDGWSLRRRQERRAATVAAETVALKSIFKAAAVAWPGGITLLKINNARHSYAKEEKERQLKALLSAHDYDLVRFAILTGFRCAEQFRLQVKHVDQATRSAHITDSKTGYGRAVPLCSEALAIARRHAGARPGGDWLFLPQCRGNRIYAGARFVQERCRAAFDRVLGKAFQWRDLRHTFATRLVTKGAPIYHVKELMGHESVKTTQRYSHLASRDLRETLALLR